jgi:hypothetical protein
MIGKSTTINGEGAVLGMFGRYRVRVIVLGLEATESSIPIGCSLSKDKAGYVGLDGFQAEVATWVCCGVACTAAV